MSHSVPAGRPQLALRAYQSADAFAQLERPWRDLCARATDSSVFCTWEWQSAWWNHFGPNKSLHLLTAWDGDCLVGLLPLYAHTTRAFRALPVREVRLVGTGGDTSPDYLGAILDPQYAVPAGDLLARGIVDAIGAWDVLRLTDLAPLPFVERTAGQLRAAGCHGGAEPHARILIVRSLGSWEAYLKSLSADRRRRVRLPVRNAKEKLSATFRACTTGADLAEAFDSLVRLHRKRWSQKGDEAGAFRTAAYVGFHREAVERCGRNDWARLYCIDVAGETKAVIYCYRYRNESCYFQAGFDPELERFSLGRAVLSFAIEQSFGEGSEVFDLLKGEHDYKLTFANDSRVTWRITLFRNTLTGLLAAARHSVSAWRARRSEPLEPHVDGDRD